MNQFTKLCSGVYGLLADTELQHGDTTTITTQYGKEVEVTIWKLIKSSDGKFYYSVIREDGLTAAQRLLNKAEKREEWADTARAKSDAAYTRSNRDREFLSLGEPVKVGHHSERKHRKAFEFANNNMRASVELAEKADNHDAKSESLSACAARDIFIDNPDCLPRLEEHVATLQAKHEAIKANPNHARFMLANSSANIRRYRERLELAKRLWSLDELQQLKQRTRDIDISM